jgi:ubiquinone/menaquinone biosynthesis C-methylase UbiE
MTRTTPAADLSTVQAGYDRWAEVYDHDANPLLALEEPLVRSAIGNPSGKKVLDLGCGTGRHSLWLAQSGAEVIAVDLSAGMLVEARSKAGAEAVGFLQHDLHDRLPFASRQFDLIVSGLVLEHLCDLEFFFADARRVLKQRGRAVVSAMHPAMFLRGSQARFTDPKSGELVQPGSVAHSLSDLLMGAIRAGFQIGNIEEVAPDAKFASRYPRAEKYVDWPMLVVMQLVA